MKKLALCLCLVACLGMMTAPAYALPACPHTNAEGVTSVNFGNCILNAAVKVVSIITIGLVTAKVYFCGAAPTVLAVAQQVLSLAGVQVPPQIINVCQSLIATTCSDKASLQSLVDWINTYNQSQVNKMRLTRASAQIIDPTPIIDWIHKK